MSAGANSALGTGSSSQAAQPEAPSPKATPDPRHAQARLAVFDFDGTIVDGQSGSLFSTYLVRHGLITVRTLLRLGWWGLRYKLHLPYRQDEARELIFHDISRLGTQRVAAVMRGFHDEVLKPRYRADAVREVRRRKEEGCLTLLVSATFYPIAQIAGDFLGADGVSATHMELDEAGGYTGRVEGEVIAGEAKCRAVRAWGDERVGAGAWRIAYAYGDHFTDAPLLGSADTCFAVCPGKTLKSLAKRNGWAILDWK